MTTGHDAAHWARRAASFGAAAGAYAAARPGYPSEAVDFLVPADARRVLDLGAGTGKLTRSLVERGLDVVAVDPSEEMLAELRAALPGVPTHLASAERLPFGEGSFDAVVAGQAWHWVDGTRAVPEVARVLRTGGQLGLVWNVRDDSEPWVAEFGELIHGEDVLRVHGQHNDLGPPFGELERADFAWRDSLDVEGLVALAHSRSYTLTLPPDERETLLADVRRLATSHPDLAGRPIEMPYVAQCWRARANDA